MTGLTLLRIRHRDLNQLSLFYYNTPSAEIRRP